MNPHSWLAIGAGEFYVPSAPVFVRYAMRFLVVPVAVAALSARSRNVSVANPIGRKNAHTTKVLQ